VQVEVNADTFRPGPLTRSKIERHPQRQQIIDAMVRGESALSITRWAVPKVSQMSVLRFAAKVVRPTLARAKVAHDTVSRVTQALQSPAQTTSTDAQLMSTSDNDRNAVRKVVGALLSTGSSDSSEISKAVLRTHEARVRELEDIYQRLKVVSLERGAEMQDEVPGGRGGMLTRDYKGKNADVPVYKTDAALASEQREALKAIAQELGQLQDAAQLIAVQVVMPAGSVPTATAETVDAEWEDIGAGTR
jgi:hypothetical protein